MHASAIYRDGFALALLEKVSDPDGAKHPEGRSGHRGQTPFPQHSRCHGISCRRPAKAVVLLVVLLPMLIGLTALFVDGSDLLVRRSSLQHEADVAALNVATQWMIRGDFAESAANAYTFTQSASAADDLQVQIGSPPSSGRYSGQADCVAVRLNAKKTGYFAPIANWAADNRVVVSATAQVCRSPYKAALVALDPRPLLLSVTGLPAGIGTSASLAGLEVEGVGTARISGAIHINNEYGGFDEHGRVVGDPTLLRSGAICLPGPYLEKVRCDEMRVVGGVDLPSNYGSNSATGRVLKANRLPVPDPLRQLPVPVAGTHSGTSTTYFGGATVVGIPLIGPTVTLNPGIYEWIEVVSGKAVFNPGIYIIKGKQPITQLSLSLLAGEVKADGVMFYITPNYGSSSASDAVPSYPLQAVFPSVVISSSLLQSKLTGLADGSSPFNGMLIFQDRMDRRPIVVAAQSLVTSNSLSGRIYSRWGQTIVAGQGNYGLSIVSGSIRLVTLGQMQFTPSHPLAAASDVLLVE